jgi:nitroimidazol reductase NimA-like FMN-containing flavoprotein (pyridoxamine 5'-phosphate oxidase superfamily)
MRKRDKETTDFNDIEKILKESKVCRLAFNDDNYPYIVPMNFGYKNRELYFHSAKNGKKVDLIKTNNQASFEIDVEHQIIKSTDECKWTARYESVTGYGTIIILNEPAEKIAALKTIMTHYSGPEASDWKFDENIINRVLTFKLIIKKILRKKSGIR